MATDPTEFQTVSDKAERAGELLISPEKAEEIRKARSLQARLQKLDETIADFDAALKTISLSPLQRALALGTTRMIGMADITMPETSPDRVSRAVESPTSWERYQFTRPRVERSFYNVVDIDVEPGRISNSRPKLSEHNLARIGLVWMAKNMDRFQNQPLNAVHDEENKSYDHRRKTERLRVAIRQGDGRYKVVELLTAPLLTRFKIDRDSLNIAEDVMFTETIESDPADCQMVIDNRVGDIESTKGVYDQLPSPYVGITQRVVEKDGVKKIELVVSTDHLFMDGVAAQELAATLGSFGIIESDRTSPRETRVSDEKHKYRRVLNLSEAPADLCPNFNRYIQEVNSNSGILEIYAQAMREWGKRGKGPKIKDDDTIFVMNVKRGNKSGEDDDNFDGEPHERRVQITLLRLLDMAQNEVVDPKTGKKYIQSVLSANAADEATNVMNHVFNTLTWDKLPKGVQDMLLTKTKYTFYARLYEAFNSVGLVSFPKELSVDQLDEMTPSYTYPNARRRNNITQYGNTIVSIGTSRPMNLFRTMVNGKVSYTISGPKGDDQEADAELYRFARCLDRASKDALLEAGIGNRPQDRVWWGIYEPKDGPGTMARVSEAEKQRKANLDAALKADKKR